jgi:hypothetical protein
MIDLRKRRTRIRQEIGRILDQHCKGCKQPKSGGKEDIENCVLRCQVGRNLRELGKSLEQG